MSHAPKRPSAPSRSSIRAPLLTAALAASVCCAPSSGHATPPDERVGPYAEAYGGVNIAGAVDGATVGEAGTGAAFGVRGGYRILPWLAAGAVVELATLPVDGLPSGNFSFFGVEAVGVVPTTYVDVLGGLAMGYDSARGTYGDYSGFPGLRLRIGARVPVLDMLDLGVDYGVTLPQSDDEVEVGGRTYHVVPAWLHQVTVVAAVPFW